MRRILVLVSILFVVVLSGCVDDKEDIKTMMDVNIDDSVEVKMEVIMHYTGPFIDETYREIGYYDLEEEWSIYEITNYYDNGDSFIYYYETVNGNTYLYDFEDVDYDRLQTPSRFRIDDIYSEDDFNFIDAFSSEFEEDDYEMKDGLQYYYKESEVSLLGEMLQGYIQSLSYFDVYGKTVEVIMFCHPTSLYCDYRLGLDEIAEDTVNGDFDDLDLTIDIVHSFYTRDTKQKEQVFPEEYMTDDYPNTLDSLMFSGNRIFGPIIEGTIDFEYDGDVFEFQVNDSGSYQMNLDTIHTQEEPLYVYIIDEMFNFVYDGELFNQTEMPMFDLEVGTSYYLVVALADGTLYDFEYRIVFDLIE